MSEKILFDLSACQPLGTSKYHGGGVYGYIVFKALTLSSADNIEAYWDSMRFLPGDILETIQSNNIKMYDSQIYSIYDVLKSGTFKKLYSPLYNEKKYKNLLSDGYPLMITVHGLRALEMNRDKFAIHYSQGVKEKIKAYIKSTFLYKYIEKRYFNQYKNLFNSPNVNIVTVSEHSKASIKNFYPQIDTENIIVRYSPNTSIEIPYIQDVSKSAEKYYLIISADRWLKNSYRAIKAFERLFASNNNLDFKVYVIGIHDNHKIAKEIKYKDKYQFFGYVDRDKLESLLKNAYALVYPSLNEGFGYPPLEAMKYGTPVIASGIASIPEICRDAVMYCNPYSIDEIANRIIQMENIETRNKYSSSGYDRYLDVKKRQDDDLNLLVQDILD